MSFLMATSLTGRRGGKFEATGGNTVTDRGNERIHIFLNGVQNFVVNKDGIVDVFVQAGGGGGGSTGAGGAGGGGHVVRTNVAVTQGTYIVTVGAGGAPSAQGNDSSVSFGNVPVAVGGARPSGLPGGSGSGGSNLQGGGAGTAGQGNNGGSGARARKRGDGNEGSAGGGGGGAGAAGNNAGPTRPSPSPGSGGNGLANNFRTGSNITYAGGGGGQSFKEGANLGTAGNGTGGGGTANQGGGGQSRFNTTGEAGGSGIVVIKYAIDQ